jgi:hypothetical protein
LPLQTSAARDDILHMWEFQDADLPEWVREQFDQQTQLPHGPLERFPVPLEGKVSGARSCAPADGRPGLWQVTGRCAEDLDATTAFYVEYLPLAGYQLTDVGERSERRGPLGVLGRERATVVLFRRELHIGCLRIHRAARAQHTSFIVDMAHEGHELARRTVDAEGLRADPSVTWRRRI